MKKTSILLLSLALSAAMLTGCGKSEDKAPEATTPATEEATPAPETTPEAEDTTATGNLKTGLGVVTSIADSKDAGDEDGVGSVYSTIAAVLVDADGKITDCKIDAAQTKINFSKEGKVTSDLAAAISSKQELGEAYGMKATSKIGKEWNEQADAFAAYVVGKTVDEVKGIAVSEGVATDADLASSVTIHIGDFMAAVEKAVTTAQDLGAVAGDKLGLAVSTEISGSKDASADGDGLAQAYSYYSAVSTSADGTITSCYIDASQGNVNFDTKGAVTSDLAAAVPTKQELGDGYGMKAASKIGKEWFEQANAFAAYVTGKTVADVTGIAVTDEGLAGDADLISSVTVHVGSFISVVEKAVNNAK